ncbi:Metal-sulfur cluster biosynthetic enzyme [Persephonella hydrogeniphila]|uniref:Metal-sulfur cluster biosynthetic enzyme n=1 Tax=Persephonella hydrogeniphila TaxID=198703 RepID=A0A285NLB5_9AQUI|nr:metal-sulfur cluster assembly factor [Persephonella hydrogeniphila]SNZ10324.1 Metal-sulfur cluster biosynthetic enzyme [Persephonella hydrogeniphila]
MAVTKEKVYEALRNVIDPEIGFNIVDLGLVYDVQIDNGNVKVKMTLSSPSCPLSGTILSWVESAIRHIEGVENVDIELVWDPPWNIEMASEEVKKALGMI